MMLFNAPVPMQQKLSNFQMRLNMVLKLQNVEKSRAWMVPAAMTLALMATMDMLSFGNKFYLKIE